MWAIIGVGMWLAALGLALAIIGVGMWLAARLTAWLLIAADALTRRVQRWRAERSESAAARAWARTRRAGR